VKIKIYDVTNFIREYLPLSRIRGYRPHNLLPHQNK